MSQRAQQQALQDFLKENPRTKIVGDIQAISSRTGTKEMLVFNVQEEVEGKHKTRCAVLFCEKE